MTTDVERAIAELVAIGVVEHGAPLAALRDLVVSHARSLDGLDRCTGLETLSLIGCAVGDYEIVSRLAHLRVLVVENSDLTELPWVTRLELQVAVVRRNRVRDGAPLLGLPTIQSIDLTGNPLDAQTRSLATAEAGRDRLVRVDDDDTADLNTRLADVDSGVVTYRREGSLWACATGLDLTQWPEAGHVQTTHAQLEAVIRGALTPQQLLGLEPGGRTAGAR